MQKSFPLIESLIDDLMAGPGYKDLSAEKKTAMADKLRGHIEGLIIESFINRLTEEQAKELRELLTSPEALEEKFEVYAATIPGLAQDVEGRIRREFEMLKALA